MTTRRGFAVLTVCTGNICRSPLAARALRRDLAAPDFFSVESAGIRAEPGAACPPEAVLSAEVAGLDVASHRARELTPTLLAEADLVLALGRDHRRAAVSLLPRATRLSFTLREFARICGAFCEDDHQELAASFVQPRDRLVEAVRIAAASRITLRPFATPDDDDVVDPYRRDTAVYDESRRATLEAAAAVARFLVRVRGV